MGVMGRPANKHKRDIQDDWLYYQEKLKEVNREISDLQMSLDQAQIKKRQLRAKYSQPALAKKYQLHENSINRIVNER